MAKVKQLVDGETGLTALTNFNEAMKTAEVSGGITGDGTIGSPLSAQAALDLKADQAEHVRLVPIVNSMTYKNTDVHVTSDGTTVLASITLAIPEGGPGDFEIITNGANYIYDASQTIALTTGSDTNPTLNYVYIVDVTGTATLATSTVGFPTAEPFVPVLTSLVQSAAGVQTYDTYKLHAWTDHVSGLYNGHISHLNSWIRNQNATWLSGGGATVNITTNGGAADDVEVETVSAKVLQLHEQTYMQHGTTTDEVWAINDFTTPYTRVTDFNQILTDSTGSSMSGSRFNLVIWGVVSGDATCKMMVNLPSGSENKDLDAIDDLGDFADYSIPHEYTGIGFLIARLTFRHTTADSGTWELLQNASLLGKVPNTAAGGGTGAEHVEFLDSEFRVNNVADTTKQLDFDVSAVATATKRTMTVPDSDIDLTPETGTYPSVAQVAVKIGNDPSGLAALSGIVYTDITHVISITQTEYDKIVHDAETAKVLFVRSGA